MSNRAFRISFDEKVSKFVIEIQGFLGLTWKTAREGNKVRHFNSYDAAQQEVKDLGLDRIYDDFTKSKPWQAPTQQSNLTYVVGHQPAR